jgi:hypothetical protein
VTDLRARVSEASGALVAAACLVLFFVALRARGWHWPDVGVPGGTGLYFLDLRFFTSAWECVRRGVDVIPANPCDPNARIFNYPRPWLVPAPLGLGQDDTVRLGKLLVAAFFASTFLAMGRPGLVGGLAWGAALCSPAVMLGVERGNPDLVIFCVVVGGVLLLRAGSAAWRVAGHGLLFLAAVLKLYPVLAWGPVLRQRRRWLLLGGGVLVVGFVVYALATLDDVRRIRRTAPREDAFAYGAPILGAEVGGTLVVLALGAALALVLIVLARRRGADVAGDERRELDLFLAGAATFVGTFAAGHNYNYRMVFLLLVLPQLLRWAGRGNAPLPIAPVAAAAVVATLWLGTSLPILGVGDWWVEASASFPYDELLNVALFGYLAAAVALVLAARRSGIERP